jgi:hypothetical protein
MAFICCCLSFFACSEKKAGQEKAISEKPFPETGLIIPDSIPAPAKTDEIPFDTTTTPPFIRPGIVGDLDNSGNNFYNSTLISRTGKLFDKPDTAGILVQQIGFFKPLRVQIIINSEDEHTIFNSWFKVKLNNGKVGYILGKDVATHVFETKDRKFAYWVLQNRSPRNPMPKFKVIKFDLQQKKEVDSIAFDKGFPGAIPGVEGAFVIEEIKNATFPGTSILIRFAENMDYCGGGTTVQFLADSRGKFTLLPATSFFNDDGGDDYENADVYLPLNLNGKITLVGNGDPGNALNLPPFDMENFPATKDLSFPLEQLIVELTSSGEGVFNKSGEAITDKKGNFQYKNEKLTVTYYQWDGAKLKKIRSELFKN